jgi:tetratricopeptide (TPR) repeat protein
MEPLAEGDPPRVGPYLLQARLGVGGMGRVFLGRSPAGRAVAVKVVHPELARDPGFRIRFRREVRAAQSVSGAFTAPVVAAGPDDDPPWLATAFIAGPSLSEVIAAAGPLSEEAVWRLAGGLVEALQAVHACGLVHRDLKPGNVLMAADGPRVIDFGIARAMDGTALTAAGMLVGSPVCMAPEQARGELPGTAGDVFSLGGVLAYAATGSAPFAAADPIAMIYRIVHDEPDLGGLGPDLRSLVADCLVKEPASRPSLETLLQAVVAGSARYPAGSPISFWPAPLATMIAARQDAPAPTALLGSGPLPSASATWSGSYKPPSSPGPEATWTMFPGRPGGAGAGPAADAAGSAEAGDRLCAEGRYPEAERAYRSAIAAAPGFAYAHASLAVALCAMGRHAEADTACRIAIQIDPAAAAGHHNLGYVLAEQGRHEDAAAAYAQAVRLDPDDPAGYDGLGDALVELGRYPEAEEAYRQWISRDPGSAAAYRRLGDALFEMSRDWEAAAAYQEAVRLAPDDAGAYHRLGDVLFEMNKDDAAETAYRQAVSVAPGDPDSHNKLGEFLEVTGRRREAATQFREARRLM